MYQQNLINVVHLNVGNISIINEKDGNMKIQKKKRI
jgi:hypothetical protein